MPEFELTQGDSGFRQRSTDVFSRLEGLASSHEAFLQSSVAEREDVKKTWREPTPAAEFLEKGASSTSQQPVKAPEFAVPNVPPRPSPKRDQAGSQGGGRSFRGGRCRRGGRGPPDHVRNPERWTSYSLADVEEVTDAQNAAVAFNFLSELRKRRQEREEEEGEEIGEKGGKILFRPKQRRKDEGCKEQAPSKSSRKQWRCFAAEKEGGEEEEGEKAEEEEEEEQEGESSTRATKLEEPIIAPKSSFRKAKTSRQRAIRTRLSDEEDEEEEEEEEGL